jgi:hypothetical protein
MQTVYNKRLKQPATGDEIRKLIDEGKLIINFMCLPIHGNGQVWIDTIGMKGYEFREVEDNDAT